MGRSRQRRPEAVRSFHQRFQIRRSAGYSETHGGAEAHTGIALMNEAVDSHLPKMIETDGGLAPESPVNAKAPGLDRPILLALALKTAHVMPQFTTETAARRMHLPLALTGDLLEQLRTELLLETLGHDGPFGY